MSYSDSFRTARWPRFINLLLQAVLFLALFAGLNYVALNHAWRFDVTASHRHSLSPETKAYLEQLERDVTIIVTLTDNGDSEELAQAYRDLGYHDLGRDDDTLFYVVQAGAQHNEVYWAQRLPAALRFLLKGL